MLNYKLNEEITLPELDKNQKAVINQYIFESVDMSGRYSPGVFDYVFVDVIINSYILESSLRKYKGRKSISFEQLCQELTEDSDTRRRYDYFLPIVAEKMNIVLEEAEQHFLLRLLKAYWGIVGEAIFKSFIMRSKRFKLVYMEKSLDYEDNLDCKVLDTVFDNELAVQVKISSYYYNPTAWHTGKIELEIEKYKDKKIKCQHIFFNYDFNNRHFIVNDKKFHFSGYGRSDEALQRFENYLSDIFFSWFGNLHF